jgi:hypothetical protein
MLQLTRAKSTGSLIKTPTTIWIPQYSKNEKPTLVTITVTRTSIPGLSLSRRMSPAKVPAPSQNSSAGSPLMGVQHQSSCAVEQWRRSLHHPPYLGTRCCVTLLSPSYLHLSISRPVNPHTAFVDMLPQLEMEATLTKLRKVAGVMTIYIFSLRAKDPSPGNANVSDSTVRKYSASTATE